MTARDEEWQSTTQESMFNYVRLSDGGIRRLNNVKPEVEILCEIASRLVPLGVLDFEVFKTHDTIRQAIAKIVPGMEAIGDIGIAKREFHVQQRLMHAPNFKTASGKAKFVSHQWRNRTRSNAQYPFQLMSTRSEGQFNSIIYEERDSYRGTDHRWVVYIGSDDLLRLGICPGQKVTLRSEQGEMRSLVVHEFGLPSGNIMAYYPEANVLASRKTDPRVKLLRLNRSR